MSLTQRAYISNKFVIGLSTEKLTGASFSGYNSKSGDLLTLKLKAANGNSNIPFDATETYKMFYVLAYDSIMNISDTGITILE